jgi:hypothetical protein
MANDKPAPAWRNFAAWSAVGAIFCALAMWGSSSLLHEDGMGALFRSKEVAAKVGLALIFASAVVGFSGWKQPISLRRVCNFALWNAAALVLFLLAVRGFSAFGGADTLAMGVSEWIAAGVGLALVVVAFFGILSLVNAHTGARFIDMDPEAADDLRERSRLTLYSLVWMAASGLLLIMLSLAGPGGVVSPAAALTGALALVPVLVGLGIAVWRLSDELGRTLSHEAGNIAFYLTQVLGGGWAMLAHLRFVAAPAPLDWLTLFTVLMFAAAFIAAGRRKLLTR